MKILLVYDTEKNTASPMGVVKLYMGYIYEYILMFSPTLPGLIDKLNEYAEGTDFNPPKLSTVYKHLSEGDGIYTDTPQGLVIKVIRITDRDILG